MKDRILYGQGIMRFPRSIAVRVLLGAVLSLVSASGPAWAGIPDTPLPNFSDGSPSVQIMAVTAVVKRLRLQTVFMCTALDSAAVNIGVQVFDRLGTLMNDVSAGVGAVTGVGPGQTVTLATSATVGLLETAIIPLPSISQGSARIVATSSRVRCAVIVLDDTATPPVTIATLGDTVQPVAGAVLPGVALPVFSSGRAAAYAAVIPAVVKRQRVETDFFCTSLAAVPVDVGVEVFGPDGLVRNSVSAGNGAVLSVAPGQTVTIGTTGTAAFFETTVISLPGIAQGVARIVSTSPDLICSAFVVESDVTPPVSMGGLGAGLQ